MQLRTPRLVIAGLSGDGGKTLVSLGLGRALTDRGRVVQAFKKGPDYIDAAWLTAACEFPGRRLFSWARLLPMAMPAYIIAYTYTGLLDFAGPVQTLLRDWTGWGYGDYWFPEIRSLEGAALMLSLVLYPYVYLLSRAAFLGQSLCVLDVSRTLGNGPWRTFFTVAVPLARPAIVAGLSLALMEPLADYGTVQYFGFSTFTTGIFRTWYGLNNAAAAAQLAALLLLVVFLASGSGGLSSTNLVLSGIIVAAILSAGISFLKYVADEQVGVIIFWLMGSFASRTWLDVAMVGTAVFGSLAVFMVYARDLNLMALGERSAASLGVDFQRVTLVLLITASLVSAVCVAVAGIIGFVGLLVPHMMRMLTGPDNRRLLPVSMLAGAILLLGAHYDSVYGSPGANDNGSGVAALLELKKK